MPSDESMEAIGQEIRALSKRYYRDGFKDYQQRTMDEIKSKYNPEVYYGHLSDASLLFHKAHINCYWLTGGWLFREDKEGDVEICVSDNTNSHGLPREYSMVIQDSKLLLGFDKVAAVVNLGSLSM